MKADQWVVFLLLILDLLVLDMDEGWNVRLPGSPVPVTAYGRTSRDGAAQRAYIKYAGLPEAAPPERCAHKKRRTCLGRQL